MFVALQFDGVISLNDVHKELNSASGVSCSLNDADFRALTNILGSGSISLEDFYGTSLVVDETLLGLPRARFGGEFKVYYVSRFNTTIDQSGFTPDSSVGSFLMEPGTGFSVSSSFAAHTLYNSSNNLRFKLSGLFSADLTAFSQDSAAIIFALLERDPSQGEFPDSITDYFEELKIWRLAYNEPYYPSETDGVRREADLTLSSAQAGQNLHENHNLLQWNLATAGLTQTLYFGNSTQHTSGTPRFYTEFQDERTRFFYNDATRVSTVPVNWAMFEARNPQALPAVPVIAAHRVPLIFEQSDVEWEYHEHHEGAGDGANDTPDLNGDYTGLSEQYANLQFVKEIQMRWIIRKGKYYGREASSSGGHPRGEARIRARIGSTYTTIKSGFGNFDDGEFDFTQDWVTVGRPYTTDSPGNYFSSGLVTCDMQAYAMSQTQYASMAKLRINNGGQITLEMRFVNWDGTVSATHKIKKGYHNGDNPKIDAYSFSTDTRFGG